MDARYPSGEYRLPVLIVAPNLTCVREGIANAEDAGRNVAITHGPHTHVDDPGRSGYRWWPTPSQLVATPGVARQSDEPCLACYFLRRQVLMSRRTDQYKWRTRPTVSDSFGRLEKKVG